MNQVIKERWIRALRSGRYKQSQGRLYDGEGFCCLGVLEYAVFGLDPIFDKARQEFFLNGDAYTLVRSRRREICITDITIGKLVAMNDGGRDFEDIAEALDLDRRI